MKHLLLITTPADRAACEAALAAIGLGGSLTSKPDPTRPDQPMPAARHYVTSLQVSDEDALRVVQVALASPARTLARARVLAVEDRPGARVEGERKTYGEATAEHDAKAVTDPKVRG